MSRDPCSATTSSATRREAAGSVTSSSTALACAPSATSFSADAWTDGLTSARTTFAPDSANRFALAKPMPAAPPVMTAVRPGRLRRSTSEDCSGMSGPFEACGRHGRSDMSQQLVGNSWPRTPEVIGNPVYYLDVWIVLRHLTDQPPDDRR